jgi:hypothetical protein
LQKYPDDTFSGVLPEGCCYINEVIGVVNAVKLPEPSVSME